MGCFNKSCVVTGLQITYGDPIVGIKVKKANQSHRYHSGVDFDHIGSEWYPIEFPVRGIYDDYGRIEVNGKLWEGDEDIDYDSTRCDDYMFIHEWAYDHIVNSQKQYLQSETYNKYYKKWADEEWAKLKEVIDRDYSDLDKTETALFRATKEMTIRAIMERWTQRYFPLENRAYWYDKLYKEGISFEELKSRIEKFNLELGTIEDWRMEYGFQWRPSYVANQEVSVKQHRELLQKGIDYLNDLESEYQE